MSILQYKSEIHGHSALSRYQAATSRNTQDMFRSRESWRMNFYICHDFSHVLTFASKSLN